MCLYLATSAAVRWGHPDLGEDGRIWFGKYRYQVLQSDLVWTHKWPFRSLRDLDLGNQKVSLKKLVGITGVCIYNYFLSRFHLKDEGLCFWIIHVGLGNLEGEMSNLSISPKPRSPSFGAQRRFKYEASTTPGGKNVVSYGVVQLDLFLTNKQTNKQASKQTNKQTNKHRQRHRHHNDDSTSNSKNNNNNNNNRATWSPCCPWNIPTGPGEYEKSAWEDASTVAPWMHSMLETLFPIWRKVPLKNSCCSVQELVLIYFSIILIIFWVGLKDSRWCFVIPGAFEALFHGEHLCPPQSK